MEEAALASAVSAEVESVWRHQMPDFRFESMHAVESLVARSRLSSEDLLSILTEGRAIWLNNPGRHWQRRAYLLFYSRIDASFYVTVVALDPGTSNASIVTVLTRQQYENDRGEIQRGILLRALRSTGTKEDVDQFERDHPSTNPKRLAKQLYYQERLASRIRVHVDFIADSDVVDRATFNDPPGHDLPEVQENLRLVGDQPEFVEWLSDVAKKASVPIERILSIRVQRGEESSVKLFQDAV